MTTAKKTSLIILAIILSLGSVAVFMTVKERNAQFWLSYGAVVLALCLATLMTWPTADESNQPSAFSYPIVGGGYVLAVAFAIYFGYVRLRPEEMPLGKYAVVHILILAVFLVVMLLTHSSHRYIVAQEKETRKNVVRARMNTERIVALMGEVDNLPEETATDIKKVLSEVAEKLRYVDPVPATGAEMQATGVEQAIDALEQELDDMLSGKSDIERLQQKSRIAIRKIEAYERAKKIVK